jgi:hypothetical protein
MHELSSHLLSSLVGTSSVGRMHRSLVRVEILAPGTIKRKKTKVNNDQNEHFRCQGGSI